MPPRPLVLASSSPYRRELLERLRLPFATAAPAIDESPGDGETPQQLALRLAREKARALAPAFPDHWIIGSDQVAMLADGTLLGKPGTHRQARIQLARSSGQTVTFFTALALLESGSGRMASCCESFLVHFRELTEEEIQHYLEVEQPYDCAGSFKMEGLGIALFSGMEGNDPNSLTGLPLIALNDLLRAWDFNPLLHAQRNSSRD